MRLFHPVDLYAPKGDDELEYTPLQLTRLRTSAISFQRFVVLALACLLAAGVVFVVSSVANDRAIDRSRDEARLAECRRDNRQSDDAVAYARDQAQVLVDASQNGRPVSEDARARAAAYVADAEDAARELFPQRSCTPAAIDAYYEPDKARGG